MSGKEAGTRLAEWIKSRGWSKAEFARRMEILPQTVTKYVNGDVSVDNLAVKLMREGADVHWILTGEKIESGEESAMLAMLKDMGITSSEQLQKFVESSEKIKRLATLLHNEVEVIGNVQDMGGMVRVPVKKIRDIPLERNAQERLAQERNVQEREAQSKQSDTQTTK